MPLQRLTVLTLLHQCFFNYCAVHTTARSGIKIIHGTKHYLFHSLCAALALLIFYSSAMADQPAGFKAHGRFTGIGGRLETLVGPGPGKGSDWIYASHAYDGKPFDIIAVSPLTGASNVFTSPVAGEAGAWAMVAGADGNVYIGTIPTAHIMRVDWKTKKLIDMGQPSSSEQSIWQLTLGSDNNLYGGTYPSAKLIRFNPATGRSEDLGRMSMTENYSRFIMADNRGFIYIGIGMAKRDLVAYEIATGEHKSILPQNMGGTGSVTFMRGGDGAVYANPGNQGKWLSLKGFSATPMVGSPGQLSPQMVLSDGRRVTYDDGSVIVKNQKGKTDKLTTGYRGKEMNIFRIVLGPDDRLYGSTAVPGYFFWASPENDEWGTIANAGKGEVYSFLSWRDKLISAAYGFPAPVMVYRPDQPWNPGPKPEQNPLQIFYEGRNDGWRPKAMIVGPREKVYIGAVPGYGLLGGPLCLFDATTGKFDQYTQVVKDQSVVALVATKEGLIVGGTDVHGGGGSRATQSEAKIFIWDPVKNEKIFETVPVPGNTLIEALAVGQDGIIYGFAGKGKGVMFVFDPRAQKIRDVFSNNLGHVIYNAIGRGSDGHLYGLYTGGIFTIDEQKRTMKQLASYPPGITGGFAIRGERIYFTSGPQIVSYKLP